jgi:hypothetical protein
VQTINVLEPDKPQIDPIPPLNVPLAQNQFLRRFVRIRIRKVELRLVDEQLDRLGPLGWGDAGEERDGFDLDRLVELVVVSRQDIVIAIKNIPMCKWPTSSNRNQPLFKDHRTPCTRTYRQIDQQLRIALALQVTAPLLPRSAADDALDPMIGALVQAGELGGVDLRE